jgi:hypothetical protein
MMHNIFAAFSFPYVAGESGPGIGTGKVGVSPSSSSSSMSV